MHPESRRDLDLFCTALVGRGGWGNWPTEEPGAVLYNIVEGCLDRGTLAGAARDYVYRVLMRAVDMKADIDEHTAQFGADRVHDVFDVIHEFREVQESRDAAERLNWARKHPTLAACDPANDPRWLLKVTHQKYGKQPNGKPEVEAWLYATKDEMAEIGADGRWPGSAAFHALHRDGGPALTLWSRRYDGPFEEYWFRHGEHHRDDGPARINYDDAGNVVEERYYLNDIEVTKDALGK